MVTLELDPVIEQGCLLFGQAMKDGVNSIDLVRRAVREGADDGVRLHKLLGRDCNLLNVGAFVENGFRLRTNFPRSPRSSANPERDDIRRG